ncbi:unnamed protein product [Prunus brigantina]
MPFLSVMTPDYFYDCVQGLLDGLEAGIDSRDIVNIQNWQSYLWNAERHG